MRTFWISTRRGAGTLLLLALTMLPFSETRCEASNLGYHAELSKTGSSVGTLYWVSFPYAYLPVDHQPNSAIDAEDLVQDLQPLDLPRPCTETADNCAIAAVWKWDNTTGEYDVWIGGAASGTPFILAPGEPYGLLIQEVSGTTSHVLDLVGAHDPNYEFSQCWQSTTINMHWVSLPPHLAIDTSFGTSGVLDAEDLGQAMGGPEWIVQIRRFNEATGYFENWVVGSEFGTPFAVDPLQGYAVDLTCPDLQGNCSVCTWTWVPTHY